MKSSLLANEIQDLEGLELKEQVKVLKEYIEYMREQLRWYNDVTDKAGDEYVQGVTTYYGKSTSSNIQPTQWSKEAPEISDGEYLWQYTKVTRSGITTKSDPICVSSATDGEDAAIIYIHSSNGTIFRANNTGTVLSVTVYYGSDAIRTLTNLQTAFGVDAHLAWYERAYGSSTDVLISPSDSRISNYGFTLTLTSADISNRATYSCHLMLSATEERAQGSITITDIEDGQTLYATSQTAATTAAKTATVQSGTFALEAGAMVAVMFANKNTAANPTLNVDNTGAIPIRAGNASLAANSKYNWTDNSTVIFIYDGTYWQMDGVPALDKADDAAKVATNYITDVPNDDGISVSGNNATAEVLITDKVRVQADSTHFAEMTDSEFRIHSGNATNPSAYLGAEEARIAGDGAGNYLVHIYDRNLSPTVNGGTIDLYNTDGKVRVRTLATWDFGQQAFYNSDEDMMVYIGAANDGEYGNLVLEQVDNNGDITQLLVLGRVTDSLSFVNQGDGAILVYTKPDTNNTSYLGGVYGAGAAYIRASSSFAGYVAHGKTTNHRLCFDFDTISGYNYLRFWIDGVEVARIQQQSYSDERVKTDIEPIQDAFKEAVGAVDIEQFRYDFGDKVRQGANGIMFGIVAQDLVEKLEKNGIDSEKTPLVSNTDDMYSVDYTQFLLARLAVDEDRIKALEEKLKEGS